MKKYFFRLAFLFAAFSFIFLEAKSQTKQDEKITATTQVLKDFGKMKESIPADLLKVTEGIIIVPKLINAGFVIGGKHGRGIAMAKLPDGSWSNPVFVSITGGSFGLQAGVQSVDLVLIFKHNSTLQKIGNGSFTLGGDISATAGPVGRSSSASTDYKMQAEVYSYSRSKGLFAGISLQGVGIGVDNKTNEEFYGKSTTSKDLFSNGSEHSTVDVKTLKAELNSLYR